MIMQSTNKDQLSSVTRKPVFQVSDTNMAVQPRKMASGLKFRKMASGLKFHIYKVEGLDYPCSKTKGADQLRGQLRCDHAADLRLCFCTCKKHVFS